MNKCFVFIFVFLIPIFGCSAKNYYKSSNSKTQLKNSDFSVKVSSPYEKDVVRNNIAEWALEKQRLNIKTFKIGDKTIRIDCSNFVRSAYYSVLKKDFFQEAIDLGIYNKLKNDEVFSRSNFGALVIYILFSVKYKIVERPKVGDIVFFDRTYDKNNNKTLKDDILTHVGIVTKIYDDGTIEFVHAGTGKGIEVGVINFNHKDKFIIDGKYVNSYVQKRYAWHKDSETAASLVRGFGSIF